MKFTIEIELGDAMRTYVDIVRCLEYNIENGIAPQSFIDPQSGDMCRLTDEGGNIVGKWEVVTTDNDGAKPNEDFTREEYDAEQCILDAEWDDGTDAACDEFIPTVALSAYCARCGEPYNDHSTAAKGSH